MTYQVDKLVIYDLEIYPNFNLFGALWNGQYVQYDHTQIDKIIKFMRYIERDDLKIGFRRNSFQLAGFNSIGYDDPVLWAMLNSNGDPRCAYETSVAIIEQGVKYWELPGDIQSVDLMQILPGRKPLKQLGVILGHPKLQELPIEPHKLLSAEEMRLIESYNRNDLDITAKLRAELQPQLDLRAVMSERYGIDLRSKGEAAVAEAVLLSQAGFRKKDMKANAGAKEANHPEFQIRPPTWWDEAMELASKTGSKNLKKVGRFANHIFNQTLRITNHQVSSEQLAHTIYLGDRFYSFGVGGLHSVDGAGAWIPAEGEEMVDIDVASYYPSLILTQNSQPSYWGDAFMPIYKEIYEQRLEAKRAGDKTTADVLKIVLNGTYGKYGDKFSALYDQEALAHVTVHGQLSLLILIAMLTECGHRVISANTDGITVIHKQHGVPEGMKVGHIVYAWEQITGLTMEFTGYKGLYQRDVNNYIAVKMDGSVKEKGVFLSRPDLRHMPNYLIVAKAISAYLAEGTPVVQTVMNEDNIHNFILTTAVRGAWKVFYGEQQIGKIVRFYKSTTPDLPQIRRVPTDEEVKGNEGILPDSANGVPLEDLPAELPADLDHQWYIEKAEALLAEITKPKIPGMNAWAQELIDQHLHPVVVDTTTKMLSRAKYKPGETDFCSIPKDHAIAVRTGWDVGLIARIENGVTKCLFFTEDKYPSKTRETVEKKEGFQLIYGGSVEMPPWSVPIGRSAPSEFDNWYTEAELKKVRK